MNFTRPVNATNTTDVSSTPASDAPEASRSFSLWRWMKRCFKGVVYLVFFCVVIGGVLLCFAPYILSLPWVQPYVLKSLLALDEEDVQCSVESATFSWGDQQILRNVTFSYTTECAHYELRIETLTLQKALVDFLPWRDEGPLHMHMHGVDVVRTLFREDERQIQRPVSLPLPTSLALVSSMTALRVYPWGKQTTPSFVFDQAKVDFDSPVHPLRFVGEGTFTAIDDEVKGALTAHLTVSSLTKGLHATTLSEALQSGEVVVHGAFGEGTLRAREGGFEVAEGALDLAWFFARERVRKVLGEAITSISGRCDWRFDSISWDGAKQQLEGDLRVTFGDASAPLALVYDATPLRLYAAASTHLRLDCASALVALEAGVLTLPIGEMHLTGRLSPTTMAWQGKWMSNLATLWRTPWMDGLRAEGVGLEGESTIDFTFEGPLSLERERLLQSSTATFVIPCPRLILPETELPNITFMLALKDEIVQCKGDFTIRERPVEFSLPWAEIFGATPLDVKTLRAYFPHLKGML